ncbi:MAG: class I SAM-dependent methyltransferase [Pelagibacteraceae bacterium]|jgi:predicted O-methyltransferase YrrM|nr:class I SAM-dependent methyltransferase [Pelagibacteraceae bacterium]MDP6710102.1 class I SAM-dependent methyltransferase [Pelagibacteraceae bacterium]|tara:strand:+ start:782 stop:1438 length:657 start_codon:yes stop_codon:yes gene_type:complete
MLKNLKLTQELLDYIYSHTHHLHPVQKDILKHNNSLGDLQRMQISEIQAHLLQLIIMISNAKNCLEIGTFTGFSSLSMALALPNNGQITTLDHDNKTVEVAKKFFKKAELDKKILTIVAPALDSLKKLAKNNKFFDLIFIDADKDNYINYFDLSLDLVKRGGIIIIDNVFWHGDVYDKTNNDKKTNIIRKFNLYVKNDKRVEKFILPLGDGLTICMKL